MLVHLWRRYSSLTLSSRERLPRNSCGLNGFLRCHPPVTNQTITSNATKTSIPITKALKQVTRSINTKSAIFPEIFRVAYILGSIKLSSSTFTWLACRGLLHLQGVHPAARTPKELDRFVRPPGGQRRVPTGRSKVPETTACCGRVKTACYL